MGCEVVANDTEHVLYAARECNKLDGGEQCDGNFSGLLDFGCSSFFCRVGPLMRAKFDPSVRKVSVLHLVRVVPRTYQIMFYLWKYHVYHERWNGALFT
jgi:hypothetical protein